MFNLSKIELWNRWKSPCERFLLLAFDPSINPGNKAAVCSRHRQPLDKGILVADNWCDPVVWTFVGRHGLMVGFLLYESCCRSHHRDRRFVIVSSAIGSYYRSQVTSTVDCNCLIKSVFPFLLFRSHCQITKGNYSVMYYAVMLWTNSVRVWL